MASVKGDSASAGDPGVLGENTAEGGAGVYGRANANGAGGVIGHADNGRGVYGESPNGTGVWGWSNAVGGVVGESMLGEGVRGVSHGAHGAVVGVNDWSPSAPPGAGGNGGWFESAQGEGVRGWSKTPHHGGVVGVNTAGGVGVYGEGRVAGFFKGDVEVTGDIRLINADCAEDFNVSEVASVEPGTVMVLGEEEILLPSHQAYDKRVAGVISGAGNYKPGIVLDKQESQQRRLPVALLGKVYCKSMRSTALLKWAIC